MHLPTSSAFARWAFGWLNPRTIVLATLAIAGPYFTTRAEVRTLTQQVEAQDRRLDKKLDTETYREEQHQQAQDLHDIKVSVDNIQQILMERK